MTAIPSGSDALANILLASLTAGKDFSIPEIDLDSDPLENHVSKIEIADLTSGTVDGTGVFDKLMTSLVAHLKVEYNANRISGAEYTKAYIGAVSVALQTASQFILAKDSAYWQAMLVQAQARAAEIEIVKAGFDAATAEVNYGLSKIKLSTEDATYANLVKQGVGLDYTNERILPQQERLLIEQVEVQRAQTANVRTDGATVTGSVGKQKDLYDQQILSYKRDAEVKAAKLFTDAWITQKTIDEGLLAPTSFANASLETVLQRLKTNNGLV